MVSGKRNDGGEDGRSSDEADLDARRRALGSQLTSLEQKRAVADGAAARGAGDKSGMGRGFRYSSDFVAAVIVGCVLGWLFDRLLNTRPWGLIVFIVLGFVAGVVNLLKLAERERKERQP